MSSKEQKKVVVCLAYIGTPLRLPSERYFMVQITDPLHRTTTQWASGRGGAGNIHKAQAKKPPVDVSIPKQRKMLEVETARNRVSISPSLCRRPHIALLYAVVADSIPRGIENNDRSRRHWQQISPRLGRGGIPTRNFLRGLKDCRH